MKVTSVVLLDSFTTVCRSVSGTSTNIIYYRNVVLLLIAQENTKYLRMTLNSGYNPIFYSTFINIINNCSPPA